MDGQRFDDLTRVLATGTSRRGVLRGLTAGLGAALLGRSAVRAEEACPVALDLDEPCAAKVGICHRTNAEKNPYRYIEVCESAAPAHAAHGDLVACPNLQVPGIDPDTGECTCICPVEDITCPAPFVLDEALCACVCPPADCPGLAQQDPTTCECVCPVETIVCPPGEVLDEAECLCEAQMCQVQHACAGGQARCELESGLFCGCFRTTEDTSFCIQHGGCGERCLSTLDCPEGKECVFTCCGGEINAFCQFPCGGGSNPLAVAVALDVPTTYG